MIMATLLYCIVGCNTGSEDHQALHVLECDADTGAARIVQSVKGCEGTTYFQLSPDRKTLYSVIGEKRADKVRGSAVAFELDGHVIGKMTRLAELPCEAPCHVELSPDASLVSFAAYLSGTYGILSACKSNNTNNTNNQTIPICAVLPDDAVGPRKDRQKKAYAHQTFYSPDGELMGVCDLGCDRVNFYEYRKPDGLSKPVFSLKADPGDGPRHAIFSHDGKFLFVVNELSSTVTSYEWKASSVGASVPLARRVGKWSMLPPDCQLSPADTKAAAIKLTADGKILMASNRGHDSIAFFEVNADGTLRQRNVAKLRGKFPRDFTLMPGEKFMVVGHKMSNEIQVYAFDRAACALTPVGAPVPCWHPLCFRFL